MIERFIPILTAAVVIGILIDLVSSKEDRDKARRFRLAGLPALVGVLIPMSLSRWAGVETWSFAAPTMTKVNLIVALQYVGLIFSIVWSTRFLMNINKYL